MAQTTPIPDANFEQFLVDQGIDTNGVNGNILDVDAQGVTDLNVTRNDITDFSGLEAFVNLVTLNAGTNQFPTLPLTTLTALEELTFRNNQALASLDVSQNTALKEFEIRASGAAPIPTIPSLDFSQNLALETLNVSVFESITSLTFPVTTTLTDIDIAQLSVPVIDLSLLEGDIDFRIVGSRVDVNIIYPNLNTALKRLELSSIDFPTVDVSSMIGLERFELSSTSTESFQLPATNTLTSIRIWGHEINVPINLSIVPELTSLDIRNNYGSTPLQIDLTSNFELTSISLSNNLMNAVDLTQNTKVTRLDVSRNNLISIDVTQNTLLNTFDANDNQFTTIDLSQNLELEYLRLHNNQFPNLDVTNNLELTLLNIGNNLFTGTGLDLTQNAELSILYADNNQVESLDIDQNPKLRFLDISYNLFPGNEIINDFYDKIVVKGNLSDVYFKANNNLLTGLIPDFYSIYNDNDPSVVQHRRWWFNIENNYFHFGDFENQHLDLISLLTTQSIGPSADVVMKDYTYAPQEKVNAIESPTRNAGESITLTTTVRGSQNHYTWFKDGVEIIYAPDTPEYTITDLNICDAGVYHAEITSDLVPFENVNPPGTGGKNLLLVRNDITLTVNATKDCVTLANPADTATNVPINTGIEWNDNPGACGYKISVGTTSGGTDLVNNEDVGEVTVYNFASDLPSNQEIFVTITPYYDDGDFGGCAEESFITNATAVEPECTTLNSPENNDTDIPVDISSISWNPANGADAYKVAITSTSGNNNMTLTDLGDVLIHPFSGPFQNGDVVTVTITPHNSVGDAVGPCTAESFTIVGGTPQPPLCTTLDSPANNSTDVAVDVSNITWNPVANATQYRITVDGSTSNINDVTGLIVTGTSHPFTNDFDNDETVTVTIIPLNDSVEPTTTCTPETFTIVSSAPTPPSCTTLFAPADNDTDVAVDLAEITWNAVANATQYRITVDGSTSDVNDVTDLVVNGTSHPFANNFDYEETVTVTIVPLNGTVEPNTTCTSETFTIVSSVPTPPDCTTLIAPVDDATDVAVDLAEITWNTATNATQYRITIDGSASNGNDVTDLVVSGTSHPFTNDFDNGETVTVTIVPLNGTVEPTTTCNSESFTIQSSNDSLGCATLITPMASAEDIPIDTDLSWTPVDGAMGYFLTVGITSSGNDILNYEDVGMLTNYDLPTNLPEGTTIYVNITPYDSGEGTTSCLEESFTTRAESIPILGCTTLTLPEDGEIDVATNSGINWEEVTDAEGYILSIGTTSGGIDIVDNLDMGINTGFGFGEEYPSGTTLYVNITPYNSTGNVDGCIEQSFTTAEEIVEDDETKYGFSPDGDGINEFWTIDGIENHPENVVYIYNRWGDMVFQIEGYDNQSNVFNGDANNLTGLGADSLPAGTYFFRIQVLGETTMKKLTGYLVLKR